MNDKERATIRAMLALQAVALVQPDEARPTYHLRRPRYGEAWTCQSDAELRAFTAFLEACAPVTSTT